MSLRRFSRTLAGCSPAAFFLMAVPLLVANVFAQHSPPDLSGTWKLDASKSKQVGLFVSIHRGLLEIKQSGSKFQVRYPDSPEVSETLSYNIDGKVHLVNFSGEHGELEARGFWERDTLVIEMHQQSSYWTNRYSLSADGKSLAVTHQRTRGPGNNYELIYVKQ